MNKLTNASFSQLVVQYERLVYTVCFQLVRDAAAAEDLTQETFLSAYLHRDAIPPGYERQWLCRVATNKAKDYLQSAYQRHTLLPGEDKIHRREGEGYRWTEESTEEFEFPESWKGKVFFLHCMNPPHCQRALRPIQCRTFPLLPHLTEEGELIMIYDDTEVPYACPLIEETLPLNDDFVKATTTVWRHLIRDPLIYDLVKADSEDRYE